RTAGSGGNGENGNDPDATTFVTEERGLAGSAGHRPLTIGDSNGFEHVSVEGEIGRSIFSSGFDFFFVFISDDGSLLRRRLHRSFGSSQLGRHFDRSSSRDARTV